MRSSCLIAVSVDHDQRVGEIDQLASATVQKILTEQAVKFANPAPRLKRMLEETDW